MYNSDEEFYMRIRAFVEIWCIHALFLVFLSGGEIVFKKMNFILWIFYHNLLAFIKYLFWTTRGLASIFFQHSYFHGVRHCCKVALNASSFVPFFLFWSCCKIALNACSLNSLSILKKWFWSCCVNFRSCIFSCTQYLFTGSVHGHKHVDVILPLKLIELVEQRWNI